MAIAIVLCNAGSIEVHYNVKGILTDDKGVDTIVSKRTHKTLGELGFAASAIESAARKASGIGANPEYRSTGAEPAASGVVVLGEFHAKGAPTLPKGK